MIGRGMGTAVAALIAIGATLHEGGGSVMAAAVVRLSVVAMMLGIFVWRGAPRVRAVVWAPLLTLSAWLALGTLRAPATLQATQVFWDWLILACALPFVMTLKPLQHTYWLQVLRGAGLLHAGVAIYQTFGSAVERATSSFLNTNHLAGWLGACALLSLAGAINDTSNSRRWVGIALTCPMLLALLLSGSRGALLGLLVGGVLIFAKPFVALLRRRRWVAMGLLTAVVVIAALSQFERLEQVDPFRFYRVKIWSASLQLVADQPLWGSGPGQFPTAAARYAFADERPPLRYDHSFSIAHSDYLRLPAEWGLPAALIGVFGVLALTRARRRIAIPVDRGALAVIGSVMVQGLVDDPSRWVALRWLFLLQVGVALAPLLKECTRRAHSALRRRTAAAIVLVLVSALLWSQELRGLIAHTSIPWERIQLTSRALQGGTDEVRAAVAQAIALRPGRADLHRLNAELVLADSTELDLPTYRAARQELEAAIRLDPRQFVYSWALARLEGRACLELFKDVRTRERAVAAYERAMRWAPQDVRVVIDGAQFARAAGDSVLARRWLEAALKREPNAAPARLLAAELEWERSASTGEACAIAEEVFNLFRKHQQNLPAKGYSRELLNFSTADRDRWRGRCDWGTLDG